MKKTILTILLLTSSLSFALTSFDVLEQKARKGDATSQYKLGLVYNYGIKTNKDIDMAKYWYNKASKNGVIKANTLIGVIYYNEGNEKKAMDYLKKSIIKKEPLSMVYYGKYLLDKDKGNLKLAQKYFKEGIDSNVPLAYLEYAKTKGDYEKDYANAYIYASKALMRNLDTKEAKEKVDYYKSKLSNRELFSANQKLSNL